MTTKRIHVTGASGSGVTTIGRALASALALPHHDTDDYFWLPTEPPYRDLRPIPDRIRLMREMFVPRAGWVLSGSLVGWAQEIEPCFDAVIYVSTPTPVRLARLRKREEIRYGTGSIAAGGSRYEEAKAFLDWAAAYDDPSFKGRSRARHEAWLKTLRCEVARADGTRPTAELVGELIRGWLPARDEP
jgi:adenylate kinase family enzyme